MLTVERVRHWMACFVLMCRYVSTHSSLTLDYWLHLEIVDWLWPMLLTQHIMVCWQTHTEIWHGKTLLQQKQTRLITTYLRGHTIISPTAQFSNELNTFTTWLEMTPVPVRVSFSFLTGQLTKLVTAGQVKTRCYNY